MEIIYKKYIKISMKNLILNKMGRQTMIGVLLLVGLTTSACGLLVDNNETAINNIDEKKQIISVETVKATLKNISNGISLSGITKPLDEVMVSPKMTGKIINFYAKEGGSVNAGQIIARLEQDSTLLASYNNAQTALTNTIAAANQDISNVELAVATAEMILTNTKINAEENIKNAELAIDSANVALKSAEKSLNNTQNSGEQSIQNAYDNIKTTMQSNLSSIKTALTAVGDIISEAPGTANANDDYDDVLGRRDLQSLSNTKNLFSQAKKSYEDAENNYYDLNALSLYNNIDSAADEMNLSLNLIKDTLNQTLIMLDNTITKSGFTSSDLSVLKTSVNTNLTSANTAISALQSNQQTIAGAKLSDTSGGNSAATAYDLAKKNLEKAEQGLILVKTQSKTQIDATEKQLESIKANLESAKKRAKLQISSAEGQINSINAQLENTAITAPISGILNQTLIETGEMAIAGKPIASIINTESIKIELAVTEFDIGRILDGQEASISLSAYPDEKFLGNIYYIGLAANQISKKFPVKIQISNEDKKIKAGMVAQVKILSEERKDALVIPETTIFTEESLEKVYTVDKNKRIKILSIKTEPINGGMVLIKDGLAEGDIIVLNGNYELKDGDEVNIIN